MNPRTYLMELAGYLTDFPANTMQAAEISFYLTVEGTCDVSREAEAIARTLLPNVWFNHVLRQPVDEHGEPLPRYAEPSPLPAKRNAKPGKPRPSRQLQMSFNP